MTSCSMINFKRRCCCHLTSLTFIADLVLTSGIHNFSSVQRLIRTELEQDVSFQFNDPKPDIMWPTIRKAWSACQQLVKNRIVVKLQGE